jgi:phosphatidylserine/phosphatidylglycerophosphate/cardiolipin synthase-like enzyme
MSSQNYLRTEQVHIDEVSCKALSTIQWFAENKNKKDNATHPITHNNHLTFYICGELGFGAIAEDIANAKKSIDLICWGFDPGMELVRTGSNWPRGETYGDLLIAAGKRGVEVRLLIWHCFSGIELQKNMPGHSIFAWPWRSVSNRDEAKQISSKRSLELLKAAMKENPIRFTGAPSRSTGQTRKISTEQITMMAREEFCHSWYQAAMNGWLKGISVCTRDGDPEKIKAALSKEAQIPTPLEREGMVHFGTHHQKPILIDFAYEQGKKAVGYVMGLNSVTDYWDTTDHHVENPLRELGCGNTDEEETQGVDGKSNFRTLKPYRDYACRLEGQALIAIHENFERAWTRSGIHTADDPYVCKHPPLALLTWREDARSTVQIVRTQPEEEDFTIKDIYFNATRVATAGTGYLYIENQYFQYQEWSEHLLATRKRVVAGWGRSCAKIGKTKEDLPIMHVFIVIPAPERAQMIPRTYEALATLGQEGGMTGQTARIKQENEKARILATIPKSGDFADRRAMPEGLPEVIETENNIRKISDFNLEKDYRLRVCVVTLNACEFNQATRMWRFREIYIHSKLLLVDDSFLTLGSANLNQRSMVADSEINLATNDRFQAIALRVLIWSKLTGGKYSGENCTGKEIGATFTNWVTLMRDNRANQKSNKSMTGFIVSLDDRRSSTTRLG